MNKEQNIYNFKAPKSSNEETNFFNPNGRINRFAFFARLLLVIVIYSVSLLLFRYGIHKKFGFRIEIFYETVHLYLLPIILTLFTLIQGAKRIHDVNKSGWYFLIPFYNLYLAFSSGTKGNNDYGIDHKSIKGITYFDELESIKSKSNTIKKINNSNQKDYSFTVFIITVFVIILIGILVVQSNKKGIKISTIDVTSKNIDSTINNNSNLSINNIKETEFTEEVVIDSTLTETPFSTPYTYKYVVKASANNPVYFYHSPTPNDIKKNVYFTTEEVIKVDEITDNFAYVIFTNSYGKTSSGFIKLDDLIKIN